MTKIIDIKTQAIIKRAFEESDKLNCNFVGSEHFILSILNFKHNSLNGFFGIHYDDFKNRVESLYRDMNVPTKTNEDKTLSNEMKVILHNRDVIDESYLFTSIMKNECLTGGYILKNMLKTRYL